MSRPQPQIKQLAGILNTDDNNEVMPLVHHKMAKNIVFRGMGNNLRAEGIRGNAKINNSALPAGTNECIGSFYDSVKRRIIWFNYNSNGNHGIYLYDIQGGVILPLLISLTNSTTDILAFSINYPIASINIIYATDDIGDTLIWTDRNNRPMKLNISDALVARYGNAWTQEYLTVARPMPLIPPTCVYQDDSTVNINNLRKKLYQFRYRWVYRDFTKSTWSPFSKLFAPLNPDDVANNINEQKDNRIDVTINTGGADVVKIEIAARQTEAATFSDCFLITTLDKAKLGLVENQAYTYFFFNDAAYPPLDLQEINLLFDYVPKKANAQELLNGNTIIYGGTTEGYNFDETLNVTSSVSLVDFTDISSLYSFGDTFSGNTYAVAFGGTPNAGDVVTINVYVDNGFVQDSDAFTYTCVGGETPTTLRDNLITAVLSGAPNWVGSATTIGGSPAILITYTHPSDYVFVSPQTNTVVVLSGASQPYDGVSNSIYKHKSRYGFGLVYFDDFGVTNGVVTQATMLVITPEVTTTGDTTTQIPKIAFSISHQPPIWATKYSFVRTANLSVQTLLSTVSCDTKKDSDYAYINIKNQQANQNNFPSYSFSDGDRVRIIGKYSTTIGTVYDFPISSYKIDPTISGATATGDWIVIPYDAVLVNFGTAGFEHYDIEIYTPALNSETNQQAYYEFGESYLVLNPGASNRYHQGQIQDQTGSQPATFSFLRGDFYVKKRKIPLNADLSNVNAVWIIDQSVSDLFPSKVVGNGRAFVIDEYAKETYYPTLSRWGLSYQQDTSINQTNRFYPLNFDEIDRAKGDIQRFKTRDRILRVFQNRACGQYGVYAKFIQNNAGQSQLVTTDDIITTNNINYYQGEYGIGDQYTSLVSGRNQDYFIDPVRGYHMRLSGDGLIPLSELYKGQFYIRSLITPYNQHLVDLKGNRIRIVGCYDYFEEQHMAILKNYNFPSVSAVDKTGGGVTSAQKLLLSTFVTVSGVATVGFRIVLRLTGGLTPTTKTFTYDVVNGDTLQSITTHLENLITTDGYFSVNTLSPTSFYVRKDLSNMSSLVTVSWVGAGNPPSNAQTFTFNEKRNAYSDFPDVYPEWMICAEEVLYAWKGGDLWIHNSSTYSNFFGTQYYPSIKLVFNDKVSIKKVFDAIAYQSNQIWVSDTNGDINTSMINPQTGLQQISQLKSVDYEIQENVRYAALLRDANSGSNAAVALLEGDYLNGQWVEVNLIYKGSGYAWIYLPYVMHQPSNRNF